MAVITGFVVDLLVTTLLVSIAAPDELFFVAPDLSRPEHLVLLILTILATGVGGYVAGRMARTDYALNGLLVGVVGILVGQLSTLGGAQPRAFVISSAIACLVGALGGLVSRVLPRQPHSTEKRS